MLKILHDNSLTYNALSNPGSTVTKDPSAAGQCCQAAYSANYSCGEKSYLAGIAGKDIRKRFKKKKKPAGPGGGKLSFCVCSKNRYSRLGFSTRIFLKELKKSLRKMRVENPSLEYRFFEQTQKESLPSPTLETIEARLNKIDRQIDRLQDSIERFAGLPKTIDGKEDV